MGSRCADWCPLRPPTASIRSTAPTPHSSNTPPSLPAALPSLLPRSPHPAVLDELRYHARDSAGRNGEANARGGAGGGEDGGVDSDEAAGGVEEGAAADEGRGRGEGEGEMTMRTELAMIDGN